ncbi:hypothetical protein TrLO_g5839 [Triparma laevis f. longispina]|nr:hypothetical protein TrLO_g5839 [Triparma laevis f. longispina]
MPRFGLAEAMEDDPVDLADSAYSQISSQLAQWSGEADDDDNEMDVVSTRRKSLFTRAGFVRPPLASPKLSDFKKSANIPNLNTDMVDINSDNNTSLPPPPPPSTSSRPHLSESYHASLTTLLQSYPSNPSFALQSYFSMLSKGASTEHLSEESNVWSLLTKLVEGNVQMLTSPSPSSPTPPPTFKDITSNVTATPESVTQAVLTTDPKIFRRAIILEWLETCAKEHVSYTDPSISSKKSKMWPDTLSSLLSSSKPPSFSPDLLPPLRGTDLIDESSLLSSCLQFLRAGELQEACELCEKAGQPWRAASFSGGNLTGEVVTSVEEGKMEIMGNSDFLLWRRICWNLSRSLKNAPTNKIMGSSLYPPEVYESLIYAALSNDRETLLGSGLLKGFFDRLWVNFRCLHNRTIDETVVAHNKERRAATSTFSYPGTPAVEDKSESDQLSFTQSIKSVNENTIVATAPASTIYHHAIKAIILGLDSVSSFVQTSKYESIDQLRFLAHLSLIPDLKMGVKTSLLKPYISHLVDMRMLELVAVYVSMLEEDDIVDMYVRVCLVTEDVDERRLVYNLGTEHLPEQMEEILSSSVSNTILSPSNPSSNKLSALQWLTFDDGYALELLTKSNLLLRQLMTEGLFETSQTLVLSHVPSDTVSTIRAMVESKEEAADLADDAESVIWEYESLVASVIAIAKYTLWKETLAKCTVAVDAGGDPVQVHGLTVEEKEIMDKMKERESRITNSSKAKDLAEAASETVAALQTVLLFTGGYLNMSAEEDQQDSQRANEINHLRVSLVPLLLNMLMHVNFTMGQQTSDRSYFKACMEMTVTVAKPQTFILDCLSQDAVKEFMEKVAEAGNKYVGLGGKLG